MARSKACVPTSTPGRSPGRLADVDKDALGHTPNPGGEGAPDPQFPVQLLSKVDAVSLREVVGGGRPGFGQLQDPVPDVVGAQSGLAKQHGLPVGVLRVFPGLVLRHAHALHEAPLGAHDLHAHVEGAEVPQVVDPGVQHPLGDGAEVVDMEPDRHAAVADGARVPLRPGHAADAAGRTRTGRREGFAFEVR
eukprot:CAMPEP_0175383016 /NCGR_PEP_ID=MMETSP0095-20121207/27622_1 /TAXON_ID=311494 /ORGANISM="Alexandrium monilatum, Strain CCMP3105" /LENGTH=191 /DNA_ID=CAMNT_0016681415 /DNA_START=35 /DNA_END=607 /DNA_ORIENTATION=-